MKELTRSLSNKFSGKKRDKRNNVGPTGCSFGTEESNVKVIIRVRPFIGRETRLKAKNCLDLHPGDNAITLNHSAVDSKTKPRKFTFDQVFGPKEDQEDIFENGPRQIIEKALIGFNGTIFCYGQTGSGKTYTMYGTAGGPGIVYSANQFIQGFIDQQQDTGKTYKRQVTFIEIYNEELKDLLVDRKQGQSPKLKIREDPVQGVYVENAIHRDIDSVDQLAAILDLGQKRRTVGATEMNAESSRSHSVLGIHLTIDSADHVVPQKSTLYLVDLAGSEKAGAMNTGKVSTKKNVRLQEGIKINLSLSTLGHVIKSLCEKQQHIPYRNSQLTRLLKDSLGGNSMTMMIANLSPADVNYADTLSTLQFANRAKSIKNKATKYKDPKSARIAELQEELMMLQTEFGEFKMKCTCQEDNDRGNQAQQGACCLVM